MPGKAHFKKLLSRVLDSCHISVLEPWVIQIAVHIGFHFRQYCCSINYVIFYMI